MRSAEWRSENLKIPSATSGGSTCNNSRPSSPPTKFSLITIMHSSRMRTVRCSGRRGGGCLPSWWVCLSRGVSPQRGCVCPGVSGKGVSGQGGVWPGKYLPGGFCQGVYPRMHWGRHPLERILVTRF